MAYVIDREAAWLLIAATFFCGLQVGFSIGVMVVALS